MGESTIGDKYLLVIKDDFSKYVWIIVGSAESSRASEMYAAEPICLMTGDAGIL